MSLYETSRSRRTLLGILAVVVIVALGAGLYLVSPRFESEPPRISVTPDSSFVGLTPLEVVAADAGSGLKSLTVTLSAGGTQSTLASEQYATPIGEKKLTLALSKVAGLKEGPATLRIVARDASRWHFFRGNEAVVQKELSIDLTPPTVELVADDRYINFGGVGAIVYRSSPDTATSGVRIGEYFFPGFQRQIKDQPDAYFALFAHPYNVPASARAVLVATDKAGNKREVPLVYELKNVKYRKSTIALSDSFLQQKVAPLVQDLAARQGTPKEMFIAVNKVLRKENEDKIKAVTKNASPSLLWKGAFTQLSNSKVEANFADERTYTYNGEPVDTAYHLGYDLSVTKHYPIEAANSGVVAFAGDLGIYGNCVIVDHGLGLFTLYGHLSQIDVKVGDKVEPRQIMGKSGETGLAAGDHLHFGVYLDGVAVLPVEWWDAKWIDDNISPKLEGRSGEEIAAAQSKSAHTGVRKRRR